MKGLLLTNDFPPMTGGEARYYARICESLDPRDVVVLAPALAGSEEFDVLQPYRIERRRVPIGHHPAARLLQLVLFLLHSLSVARRHGVHRIHVGHLYLAPVALAIRMLQRIPYVLYLHGGEMARYLRHPTLRRIVRAIIERADRVVVNSAFTRRHFEEMGIRHPQTVQLTMAVDVQRLAGADRAKARANYGADGYKVLLTVGRLVERKGHDSVIRALPTISEHVGPVLYLIAGEGPHEPRLRQLVTELGVADRVRFLGRVGDDALPALYAACDLFVMPSRELADRDGVEGFGIAFLEAAAAGRAAVGGWSGGIPDAVDDGGTGLLVPPDDVGAVAAAITRLLSNPWEAAAMGWRGRERAAALGAQWEKTLPALWNGS